MSEPTRSWKELLAQEPVSQARVKLYERLMEAEELIAQHCYRGGVSHAAVTAALDSVDERLTDEERQQDLYVTALGRYVEALGGRLEVRAVFEQGAVVVRREPDRP